MTAQRPAITLRGVGIYKSFLNTEAQHELIAVVRDVAAAAPLFSPNTPYGKPMSVRMTSAGKYGWYSDRSGYRYARAHPGGGAWPAIPDPVLNIWRELVSPARDPDCCLVNYYGEGARMGMHQDRDEASFDWPVLSVSLGNEGLFRVGNVIRGGKTESVWLQSGDVVVMGGDARLIYHGVDRIKFGPSSLMPNGGRINLTCRVVD